MHKKHVLGAQYSSRAARTGNTRYAGTETVKGGNSIDTRTESSGTWSNVSGGIKYRTS